MVESKNMYRSLYRKYTTWPEQKRISVVLFLLIYCITTIYKTEYGKSTYMPGVIGIDTHYLKKAYETRDGTRKSFKSLVGVGVGVRDPEAFSTAYYQAIANTLRACGFKDDRKVLCNFDFLKIFQETKKPIHQIFFKEIAPHIESINVFYTLVDPKKKMRWMGLVEKELKHGLSKPVLTFDEILDKVNNSFPAICVWRINEFLKENNISCFLDNCSVQPCDAWKDIRDMHIKVFFSGDKCNPIISTADIAIKLIDMRLGKKNLFYEYGNFREILPEMQNKVYEYSLSHRHFAAMSPLHNKLICLRDYMQHPIFYILNESQYMDSSELKNDISLTKIYNMAAEKCGCVKIYNKTEDKRHIKDGDYIIYFTDEGKKFVDVLKKMKKKVIGLDFSTICGE